MTILFTLTYYAPYVSGLTLAVLRWAEGVAGLGHDVRVLTMRHDSLLPPVERIRGVTVRRASWIVRVSKGFLSWDWIRQSYILIQDTDVLVVNLPEFEAMVPALLAKAAGKRVVAVYHCEISLPKGFVGSVIQSLLEVSNFCSLLLSDAVVTYTEDYSRHATLLKLLRFVRPGVRVEAIVPPVPRPVSRPSKTAAFRKTIDARGPVVGIAARLAAEKGFEYLFEALKNLPSRVRIAVAGPLRPIGEERYRVKIETLAKRFRRRIKFLGEVAPEDMGAFYRAIDVLVVPSVNRTEAFGLVQVEAMKCGVPVVVSNLPGVRMPVKKTGMGKIVPPRRADLLARALRDVIAHREKFIKGQHIAEETFDPSTSVAAFATLLAV